MAEVVAGFLEPFQEKFKNIDDEEVKKILREGAEKAKLLAEKKMEEVKKRVGLL